MGLCNLDHDGSGSYPSQSRLAAAVAHLAAHGLPFIPESQFKLLQACVRHHSWQHTPPFSPSSHFIRSLVVKHSLGLL